MDGGVHQVVVTLTERGGEMVVKEENIGGDGLEKVPNGVDPGSRDIGQWNLGVLEDAAMKARVVLPPPKGDSKEICGKPLRPEVLLKNEDVGDALVGIPMGEACPTQLFWSVNHSSGQGADITEAVQILPFHLLLDLGPIIMGQVADWGTVEHGLGVD